MHALNIYVHVAAGSLALILGLIALISQKGGSRHRKSGRIFLYVLSIVILTGLVGVFVFKRHSFLLLITLLSGYVGFSGFRTLKLKSNIPQLTDILASIIALGGLGYFWIYYQQQGMFWAPVVTYSAVGALCIVLLYDWGRYAISRSFYQRHQLWQYEHIYKMISAFSALLSAFAGTVLPNLQPHSQYLPSVVGVWLIIGWIVKTYRAQKPSRTLAGTE